MSCLQTRCFGGGDNRKKEKRKDPRRKIYWQMKTSGLVHEMEGKRREICVLRNTNIPRSSIRKMVSKSDVPVGLLLRRSVIIQFGAEELGVACPG
jgi:hypothetical protein